MTEALYERYKDALRRGHVAVQRGRLDEALDAYGEAARVAPERALPLVGIGQVLLRLGKPNEANTTFARALERAPTDEAAPLWFPVDAIPYDEMWEDDRLWLPLALAGEPFAARWIFDGDRLLDYELERT